MAERVEAMKAIWTEDEASYHGEFVELRPHLVLAEARPAAAPAGARRRQRADGARPRARLRRRLDAELHPRRRPARADRGAALPRRSPIDVVIDAARRPNPQRSRSSSRLGVRRVIRYIPSSGTRAGRKGARPLGDGGRRTQRRVRWTARRRASASRGRASHAWRASARRPAPPRADRLRPRRRDDLQRRRRQAEAHRTRLRRLENLASPTRRGACSPTTTTRTGGALVGARRRPRPGCSSGDDREAPAPSRCSPRATPSSARPGPCSRSTSSAGRAGPRPSGEAGRLAAQIIAVSAGWSSSTPPWISRETGPTWKCAVAVWASRKRRCSGAPS